jgi:uncharacterized damage-inducible protein DinB
MNVAYFRQLARYNAWANGRIYTAAAELSDAERKAKRPSFFGSIHATLNHILVGDRIWLSRLAGSPHGIAALDQELYGDFEELRAARVTEDERLIAIVESYDEADLARKLAYRNMAGEEKCIPMAQVLGHLFNHQTHHRGQIHGLLSATSIAPPSLDMIQLDWEETAVRR